MSSTTAIVATSSQFELFMPFFGLELTTQSPPENPFPSRFPQKCENGAGTGLELLRRQISKPTTESGIFAAAHHGHILRVRSTQRHGRAGSGHRASSFPLANRRGPRTARGLLQVSLPGCVIVTTMCSFGWRAQSHSSSTRGPIALADCTPMWPSPPTPGIAIHSPVLFGSP